MAARETNTRRRKKEELRPIPDGEIAYLRAQLGQKQEYIAILELELANTRAELNRFTEIYNTTIAPLQRRVNQLRKTLYDVLEARKQAETSPVDFSKMGARAADQREEDPEPKRKQKKRGRAEEPQTDFEKDQIRLDPALEEQVRQLFRALAKRFHPDLTADPDEKEWREQLMTQINQAYTARDLEALLALAEQPDLNGHRTGGSRRDEIRRLRIELKRLDKVIEEIEATLKQIELSSAMRLRLEVSMARRDGHDLLSDMVADLQMQTRDLEEHLYALGVIPEQVEAL
jgi:hypothetical protein